MYFVKKKEIYFLKHDFKFNNFFVSLMVIAWEFYVYIFMYFLNFILLNNHCNIIVEWDIFIISFNFNCVDVSLECLWSISSIFDFLICLKFSIQIEFSWRLSILVLLLLSLFFQKINSTLRSVFFFFNEFFLLIFKIFPVVQCAGNSFFLVFKL